MIAGIFQMLLVLPTEIISSSRGLVYSNYKYTHSVNILVVAGPNYECLYVDVGANGRHTDGRIWGNSSIAKLLDDDKFGAPKPQKIPGSDRVIPCVLLEDDGFDLKT